MGPNTALYCAGGQTGVIRCLGKMVSKTVSEEVLSEKCSPQVKGALLQ